MTTPQRLRRAPVSAVLRAEDLERAKRFYSDVLGLDVLEVPGRPHEVRVVAGETTLLCLYERPGMPAPENTTACFDVDDIDSVVGELRIAGVEFADYDMPEMGLVTIDGIATMGDDRRAWFHDSEGNAIVVRQSSQNASREVAT